MQNHFHPIYQEIKEIIIQSRQRVFRMANSALLETYWQIGKVIIRKFYLAFPILDTLR